MNLLTKLSCAFASGVVGAVVLDCIEALIYGNPSLVAFKTGLYQDCVWGGVWALLLVLPFLKEKWFIRGSIIGVVVIFFNYLVLSPLKGHGYFSSNLPLYEAVGNLLNYIWGIAAAFWFYIISKNNKYDKNV
ncbi:membrane lipoprotein [Francisella halioticida]|uniref:Membrane lipoprotein n=1 Tax=Francisella halioticida TaxID=549298 RepID=A0ABM6LXI9_9GAMM|nr:membrane lipoprotein [Francisella halioticida]ASG67357.1 membrane lipoprotein [Francisella halioticida]